MRGCLRGRCMSSLNFFFFFFFENMDSIVEVKNDKISHNIYIYIYTVKPLSNGQFGTNINSSGLSPV